MKPLIFLLSLMFMSSCVTKGTKNRAVASSGCNIKNYQNFINKPGVHNCGLRYADFEYRRFVFERANLAGADFSRGLLKWTGFSRANLRGAKFISADLRGAGFSRANLEGAIFTGANLTDASFKNAILRDAVFLNANLTGAYFMGADLRGADLRGAKLYKTVRTIWGRLNRVEGVFLNWAELEGAKVTKEQAKYLATQGYSGFVVVE